MNVTRVVCVRLQRHAAERPQRAERLIRAAPRLVRVELRDLVAGAIADVGDVEGDLDLAGRSDARRRQRQVA